MSLPFALLTRLPTSLPKEPAHLLGHFINFTQIPRPSGEEQAIREYIQSLAEQFGASSVVDQSGNLVVTVPASPGFENKPCIGIQNHLDMVTVKTDGCDLDFHTEGLNLEVNGHWLTAKQTTLGADNGVGCAAALALMTDSTVQHPELELIFTVEEETGLYGASGFDASLMKADLLLNLDTEDWGELFIGCAGGKGWQFQKALNWEPANHDLRYFQVSLKNLTGGHSGIQIHQQLGNAIKLLTRFCSLCVAQGFSISGFASGIAHNVIPREGVVSIAVPVGQEGKLEKLAQQQLQAWRSFLPECDQDLSLSLTPIDPRPCLSKASAQVLLNLLTQLPHGAASYSFERPADLVSLSSNLAKAVVTESGVQIETSMRFFNEHQAEFLKAQFDSLVSSFSLDAKPILDYPGWQPDFNSGLLALAKEEFERLFGYQPEVKAIHAGLECGILKAKKPSTSVISFGPTITGAHSPSEQLDLNTLQPFWQLLTSLVHRL